MSVASYLLSMFSPKTPIQEAFSIKILGFDNNSNSFYISIGGINYKYSPKSEDEDMKSLLRKFYRESHNPAKALAYLKSHTVSEKINKVPTGLTIINSIKDFDKLSSESENNSDEK